MENISRAARHLSSLVQIRTVSELEPDGWDREPFARFRDTLETMYPLTHSVLERTLVADHALLYRWPAGSTAMKDGTAADTATKTGTDGVVAGTIGGSSGPVVFMSHYDVVPASDEGWNHPAFSGVIADGKIWGRGTIDTKCTLVCAMEAVETLLTEGFVPARDLYLSFGHDEEVGGTGAQAIVAHLEAQGIRPDFVLDEGGAVVEGVFPGVSRPLAMVGVAEKGVTDVMLSVRSPGGHSSTPPRFGAAWRLARAILRLEKHPFPGSFPDATRVMFRTLAPHAKGALGFILKNLWLTEPLLVRVFGAKGGEMNAMCRTTTVVTMLEGSPAANVLPAVAKAIVNIRIAIGSSVKDVMARLADIIDDPLVETSVLLPGEPSPVSKMDDGRFATLGQVVHGSYPDAIVTPYVVMGGTDARHFARISDGVYRFSPFTLSRAERASMHAVNEALPLASLEKGVDFYTRLARQLLAG